MRHFLSNEWRNELQNGSYGKNMPEWLRDLHLAVLDKYEPYINDYNSFSGSVDVYPLSVWQYSLTILLNTRDKRHFPQSGLNEIVKRFPQVKRARFYKYDGSCPDELVFKFKEPMWE